MSAPRLSKRLQAILDALPLTPGMRVLEVGCGPGSLARAMADRVGAGEVLAIDRSVQAIARAVSGSTAQMAAGRLAFRTVAAEDFVLTPGDVPFDLIVAVRGGALDGRHPAVGARAWPRLRAALAPEGRIFMDGVEVTARTVAVPPKCLVPRQEKPSSLPTSFTNRGNTAMR
jgi:cyclopropane fatty-acyl-phospholipid synthase-like methyltransferase